MLLVLYLIKIMHNLKNNLFDFWCKELKFNLILILILKMVSIFYFSINILNSKFLTTLNYYTDFIFYNIFALFSLSPFFISCALWSVRYKRHNHLQPTKTTHNQQKLTKISHSQSKLAKVTHNQPSYSQPIKVFNR